MYRFFLMFWTSVRLGKSIPFKVLMPARIRIFKGATILFKSRVVLGNNRKQLPVSQNTINLAFGKNSATHFGKGVSLGPGVSIVVKDGAQFSIGDHTYITSDSHIEAVGDIKIGSDCAISWGVTILDDNHHVMIRENATEKSTKLSVTTIGNHVWIGCNSTILAGTIIGDNCIVAAGSVVKGSFPPGVLIAGNPARMVKENVVWK